MSVSAGHPEKFTFILKSSLTEETNPVGHYRQPQLTRSVLQNVPGCNNRRTKSNHFISFS